MENNKTTVSLKMVTSKRSIGPGKKDVSLNKLTKSAAVRKVAYNNNLKVEITTKEAQAKKAESSKVNNSTLVEENDPTMAVKMFIAFDRFFSSGTLADDYMKKLNDYHAAQLATYEEMGVPIPKNGRPELSEEQREFYNKRMQKYSFTYYTTAISYRDGSNRAVRSKSVKTLTIPDRQKLIAKLQDLIIRELNSTVSISVKEVSDNKETEVTEEKDSSSIE